MCNINDTRNKLPTKLKGGIRGCTQSFRTKLYTVASDMKKLLDINGWEIKMFSNRKES